MRLNFINEGDTYYACALDQIYEGELCNEWLFAEIAPALAGFMVRWESDFSNPIHFETLSDAQIFVEKNHFKHRPLANGSKFLVDDED